MLIRQRASKENGFTLIELLIVVIVLGILVAIVLFSLGTFKSDSQVAACKSDLKHVQTAATAFQGKNNAWPTNLSDLSLYLQDTTFPSAYGIGVGTIATGATATLAGCTL